MDEHLIIADLATVKAQLEGHKNDREELIKRDEQIFAAIEGLRKEMNQMKGFLGGVAFVFTGIGTVVGMAISYLSSVGH
jgi:hypothetical protein